jgi:hypothetical protein
MLDCLLHLGVIYCSANWAFYSEIRHDILILLTDGDDVVAYDGNQGDSDLVSINN